MSILNLFKRKPESLIVNDELGTFILKNPKKDSMYEGKIKWLDTEAFIDLEIDNAESHTADIALGNLRKIADEAVQWDKRFRQYAAEDMSDGDGNIEIWEGGGDSDADYSYITKEKFISRISIDFIHIYTNGTIAFYYDLDGMFTDHGLEIRAMISGEILSSGICG